jgi:hypothetical protein
MTAQMTHFVLLIHFLLKCQHLSIAQTLGNAFRESPHAEALA